MNLDRTLMAPDGGAEAGGGTAVAETSAAPSEPRYAEDPTWSRDERTTDSGGDAGEGSAGESAGEGRARDEQGRFTRQPRSRSRQSRNTSGADSAEGTAGQPDPKTGAEAAGDDAATNRNGAGQPVQPETPAAPQYDTALLSRAHAVGLSPEEVIPLMDSPAALKSLVESTERYWRRVNEQQQRAQQAQQQTRTDTAAPATQRFWEARKQQLVANGWDENDAHLQAQIEFEQHLDTRFGQMERGVQEHLQKLADQQAWLMQQHQQAQLQSLGQAVDRAFSELPEEFKGVFGEGGYQDLPPEARAARERVFQFIKPYLGSGADIAQLVRKGAYAEFGDKSQSLARQQVVSQARTAASRQTSRPTNNGSPAPRPGTKDAARAFVMDFWKERGIA